MKTQNDVNAVCPELVVAKVEDILKHSRLDMFKNKQGGFDQYTYKELSKEIGLIIDSLYEKDLIPNYKLLDLIKYAKRTDNIFAKVIVEIDFLNEIATMNNLEEIRIIKDFSGYYGDAYIRCNKK